MCRKRRNCAAVPVSMPATLRGQSDGGSWTSLSIGPLIAGFCQDWFVIFVAFGILQLASTAGRHDCACRAASETAPPYCLTAERYPRSHVVVAHLWPLPQRHGAGRGPRTASRHRRTAPAHQDLALRHDTTWALPYWCADVPHLCLKPIPSHASAGGPGSILAKRPPQAAWD
jgi:hypothetical protein